MITLPREGLQHPVFESVSFDDFLEVRVRWREPLHKSKFAKLSAVVRSFASLDWGAWGAKKAKSGKVEPTVFTPSGDGTSALMRLRGVTSAAPLAVIASALGEIAPLVETIFVVCESDGDEPASARLDPRAESDEDADDEDDFWARSFDRTRPPPPTEDSQGLFSIVTTHDGEMTTEFRIMPFCAPPFRVVYGVADVEDEAMTPRAREVAECLKACFARSFELEPPTFFDREAKPGTVTPISREGRHGYSFAVEREGLFTSHADGFRYREHELLYATTDACVALGLEPVVHWERDECYLVNVWERMSS